MSVIVIFKSENKCTVPVTLYQITEQESGQCSLNVTCEVTLI